MIPTYQNSSTSSHEVLQSYTARPQASSCLPSHAFNYTIQDQEGFYLHKELPQPEYHQEASNMATSEGSNQNSAPNSENNRGLKFSLWKKEDGNEDQSGLAKWTCSKMRVMGRTMIMKSDHMISTEAQSNIAPMKFEDQKEKSSDPMQNNDIGSNSNSNSPSSNSNSPIRVCSDCNTTKTPLWRSGPRGPKSLCNACGIRQRKARKAMAMAAAAATATTTAEKSKDTVLGAKRSSDPLKIKLQHKAKRSNINGHVAQYKKSSKLAATQKPHERKKLCFEDFLISLSKNLAIQQVFPQDEKEAAILLMALSCGLVHG